jgi:RNA polymerase sigma factor (TIGR02999 family)
MEEARPREITQLLHDWSKGDKAALDRLTPVVYQELHRLANSHLRREQPGHTLQPTARIHEAYLRLIDQNMPEWSSRAHFFGVAARYMRQILVDHARRRRAEKRGGGQRLVPLAEAEMFSPKDPNDLVTLSDAMDSLSSFDERKGRLVELRYFGGMTVEETAEATGLTVAVIRRELRTAEAWLRREITGGRPAPATR